MREEEEQQSEYTRRYSSTTSPTVGHACYMYIFSPLSHLRQNPIPTFLRAHDVVQPQKKTLDECKCVRTKCIVVAGTQCSSHTQTHVLHHDFARASYSGPPSAEPPYYAVRGQEVTRSPQVHSCLASPHSPA